MKHYTGPDMGIDCLDFTFRIEKATKIKIDWKEIEPLWTLRTPRDLSAEEVHRLLIKVWARSAPIYEQRWTAKPVRCAQCRQVIGTIPIPGYCRVCGAAFSVEAYLWDEMATQMAEAFGITKDRILPESLLKRDLGMS